MFARRRSAAWKTSPSPLSGGSGDAAQTGADALVAGVETCQTIHGGGDSTRGDGCAGL